MGMAAASPGRSWSGGGDGKGGRCGGHRRARAGRRRQPSAGSGDGGGDHRRAGGRGPARAVDAAAIDDDGRELEY
uniref:Uncharacterized protein n=1 Tax=Oryza barthii TaxID=65489 RepID=A0A0D3G8C1_9ORYZ